MLTTCRSTRRRRYGKTRATAGQIIIKNSALELLPFPQPPMATVDASKELVLLSFFGGNTILTTAGLLTTSVLYGVYLVLFFAAMCTMCQRADAFTGPRIVLLAAVIVLFLLSTNYICCTFSYFALGTKKLLVENPGSVPLLVKDAAFLTKYHALGIVGEVTFPIASVIGDSIVIWRAWVLSGGNKKVMFLPVMLLLSMAATTVSFVVCMIEKDLPTDFPPECRPQNTALFVLSMVTNIAGTAVIGYQAWSYRRVVKKYLHNCRHRARAEKLLVMLLDSGVIYTTLWIIQLAVLVAPSRPDFTVQIFRITFSAACSQLVGIYPTLIIVLVMLRRSIWDSAGTPTVCEDTGLKKQSEKVSDDTGQLESAHDTVWCPVVTNLNLGPEGK
ncbi:hypothetical protein E1B28_009602 [Marasmius oreades]|uniref:Uncharacterized protein n=1 Tax=Marasmius oreades TaxID=181124 RepID=A0A9P7RVE1_9AGAR|nr:uncharacterized protein E1B28_009602 [Marasmius oreades]KAG7090489.1 hypothetical protein E1B28_009602 [Marasmius oreades]